MSCECNNWTRTETRILTKHHAYCKDYDPVGDSKEIIDALLDGILCWAADEDGVHPECFEAFKKAAFFVGRPRIIKDDNDR